MKENCLYRIQLKQSRFVRQKNYAPCQLEIHWLKYSAHYSALHITPDEYTMHIGRIFQLNESRGYALWMHLIAETRRRDCSYVTSNRFNLNLPLGIRSASLRSRRHFSLLLAPIYTSCFSLFRSFIAYSLILRAYTVVWFFAPSATWSRILSPFVNDFPLPLLLVGSVNFQLLFFHRFFPFYYCFSQWMFKWIVQLNFN